MMRVLVVKTSSMGDLIHTLPALTDAKRARPELMFDWVVEESFAQIPAWHYAVDRVIVMAWRRWRKQPWQALKKGEILYFWQQLRATKYDYVIDAQALVKSAFITRLARGKRYGYDADSVRGRFAHLAYDKQFFIDRRMHAITHIRQLFAQVLGYVCPEGLLDYGIDRSRFLPAPLTLPTDYLVFIPNATWTSKLWPEAYWKRLIALATQAGHTIFLPSGNAAEQARVTRLAQAAIQQRAHSLPKMHLSELATVIAGARAAVFVDTGLGHLAAALNIPAVSLYGPTDTAHIGTLGPNQIHLSADFLCAPCKLRRCNYHQPSTEKPACFTTIPPEKVWTALQQLLVHP